MSRTRHPEFLQSFNEIPLKPILVDLLEISRAEFVISLTSPEHRVSDHEHRVSCRHGSPLDTSSCGQVFELG